MKRLALALILSLAVVSVIVIPAPSGVSLYAEQQAGKLNEEERNIFKSINEMIRNGEYQKALNKSQEFIDKYPDSPLTPVLMSHITYIYIKMGDEDKAIEAEENVMKKYEGTKESDYVQASKLTIYILRGIKSEKEGKFDKAIAAYNDYKEKIVADKVDDDAKWVQTAAIELVQDAIDAIRYYQNGEKDKALEVYKKHLLSSDTLVQLWAQRGINRCTKE